MLTSIDPSDRARRLGNVAALLIELARRHAAQVAVAEEGKQEARAADDDAA